MLVCQAVDIKVPEDLAADGPLHLMGVADPDFGAYDISSARTTVLKGVSAVGLEGKATSSMPVAEPKVVKVSSTKMKAIAGGGQQVLGPLPGSQTPVAICSTCDDGVDATTALQYYGTGQVQVTWTVDGVESQQTLSLPPSTRRMNLKRQGFTTVQFGGIAIPIPIPEPPIIVSTSTPIYSPGLQVQPLGNHSVMVSADVLPQPTVPNLAISVGNALGSLLPLGTIASDSAGRGGSQGSGRAGPNVSEAQSLLKTLAAPAGSTLPPLKVGLLSSSNHSVAGLGAVQYINGPLQQVVPQLGDSIPDQHVASNATIYEVVASDPTKACKFFFPANNGEEFEISGLQNHVTRQGTTYNGSGNLILHLANAGSESYDEYPPVQVKITNWSVPDGLHVQTGSIDVAPNLTLAASVPGLQGSVQRIVASKAGGELDATLNVSLADDTLRLPAEQPVVWNGVQAELHANGDWMKDGLTLPTTLIGWSAFTMQSNQVRLDLSHHDGDAANATYCGSLRGGDWVGVRFPSLTITPYTMDLVSSAALQPVVSDWGVVGNGLCGALNTGPFSANLGAGKVSFASINATAFDGTFTAQYNGMDVYVPWLDTHLTGNATLQSGGGKQASISFPLSSPSVTKSYGNFGFTASNLQFVQRQNLGWVVQADTHFVFSAKGTTFAAFDQVFNFGMDGRGYFAQGAPAKDVSLAGSSQLGQTPVDLASVHLTVHSAGSQVMAALFNTKVHLSEVMSGATVQVNYSLDKNGANYVTSGPSFAPFTLEVPYPSGQPSADAKIHPVDSATGGSGGSSGDEISGTVDLSELGGPPITGEFRLGYMGGHDYWLTRVSYALGPDGLPLIDVPVPLMNLYRVQGGLGHNFPVSAFEDTSSLSAAKPVIDNSFMFMAGMRVGMPDQFTYTLDGDLVIKAGGQDSGARLDFHAWLLKMADSGNGDFQGYLQYAGGNFDARLWGHLNLMDGLASVDMGNSASNAAVDLHVGPSGPWHIDAGKQEGPRISGNFLDTSANMYVMLSSAGLAVGVGESIHLNVGDDSVASAYVRGDVEVGVMVTPQPHLSGDFAASVSAGVCVDSVCVSAGVSAQIHAEALPLEMNASASIGLPWPLGSVSFSVHM